MTKKLRFGTGVFSVALVVAVVGATAGAASAHGRGHRHHHARSYVALGDSLAFGYSELLEDPWIPEQFVGYPEVIGQRTGMTVTNLACPGQTAPALLSRDAPDNGCFDLRDFAASEGFPVLHTDYAGTQLEAALDLVRSDAPPSLVSIQGGGNDWFLCGPGREDPNVDIKTCLDESLPVVAASLGGIATQLRDAGYRGPIVFVGYHLVEGFEGQLRRLDRTIEQAARDADVAYADAARPFRRYAKHRGGGLCTAGLLVALPDGSCDPLHPSLIGHELVATAVLEAAGNDRRGNGHGDCHRHEHESRHRGRNGHHG